MTNTWYERIQGATANLATNAGEPWDAESIETVIAFTHDVTDEELAITTGRTLAAIWSIQNRIAHEGVDPVRAAYAVRSVARAEIGYDYVTTFPPGHDD